MTRSGDTFNFIIDPSKIKELNDLVDIANSYRQSVRQGTIRKG